MFSTLGKYTASSLGWHFDNATGPNGKESMRYIGQSQGFMGSRYIQEMGFKEAVKSHWLAMGFAGLQGGMTGYFMYEGWKENGMTGAAGALGEMVAAEAIMRKAVVPLWNSTIGQTAGAARKGYLAGRGITTSTVAGHLLRAGGVGGRVAGGVLGMAGAGAAGTVAAIGGLFNPMVWIATAGAYGASKMMDYYDSTNRNIARQRMVNNLEMGSPILDQFGTVSTLRQRSLAAIQNSKVNGRMALGQEAALLHS